MAAVARYLADVNATLGPLIEAGLVSTCAAIEFEILWSTRSADEYDTTQSDRSIGYEWLATEDTDWQRALEVQQQLWANGQMRSVPLPDLLIAAVAERHRVTVLHYDANFDKIAAVTDQPVRWGVARGSVA